MIKINNIKKYRLQKNLTQKDLANATGLSQGYISGLEKGIRNPSLKALDKIAVCLGIDITKLISLEEAIIKLSAQVKIDNTYDINELVAITDNMFSIVDNWLEVNKLTLSKDGRTEVVAYLLDDCEIKAFDSEIIKKIEKKLSLIMSIVAREKQINIKDEAR